MESSCAVAVVVLQILLCAVVGSSITSENSTRCNVKSKSGSVSIPCDVTLTSCDARVLRMSLFSPPVNNFRVFVEGLQNKSSGQYLSSLATMRWNLPDRSEHLTEFLVHLQTFDDFVDECYLFSVASMTATDDPEFGLSLPLAPNNYTVRIHSHLESSLIHGSQYTVPTQTIIVKRRSKVSEYRNVPAYWITDLVVCSDSCSRSVTVTFELAPDAYRFSVYIAQLLQGYNKPERTMFHRQDGQRHGTILFRNVTAGNYTIEVFPENTDFNDSKLCRCKCGRLRMKRCSGSSCIECLAMTTNAVTIHNVNAGDCCVTTDDPLMPTKITGIAIGCFLAAGLVVLFIWFHLRPKHIDINIHSLEKQEVFLLYLSALQRVVHPLRHYLNRRCNCSVRTMHDDEHEISQNRSRYIEKVCSSNSKILLINSSGIASSSPQLQPVSGDPLDPMVPTFLEYLHSEGINEKVMIAKFECAEVSDTARLVNHRQHEYLLLKEIELLVLHIHGRAQRTGRCVYHITDVQKSLNHSPEGQSLRAAASSSFSRQDISDCLVLSDSRRNVEPIVDNQVWEPELESTSMVDIPVLEYQLGSASMGDIPVWEPELESPSMGDISVWQPALEHVSMVDIPGREPADEYCDRRQLYELDRLCVQLIPPISDSLSSLNSDCETQLWSSELNADFDSHNS